MLPRALAPQALLLSKSLRKVFDKLWEAADTRYTRLGQEAYMNYHLSVSRAIIEISDPGREFDVMDAFDAALDDWERDTDHGALPAIHEEAFFESLFEVRGSALADSPLLSSIPLRHVHRRSRSHRCSQLQRWSRVYRFVIHAASLTHIALLLVCSRLPLVRSLRACLPSQLVDSYSRSLTEADYIAFAKRLVKHCVVKKKGEQLTRLRHSWPVCKKPGRFLSAAVEGLRRQLELPKYAEEQEMEPPQQQTRRTRRGQKKDGRPKASMLDVVKALPHALILDQFSNAQSQPAAKPPPPLMGMMRAMMRFGPKRGAAANRGGAPSLEYGRRPKAKAPRKLTREEACVQLFRRWATPVYSDVEPSESRIVEHNYVKHSSNRRHPDDTTAVRLCDLALLLSDAGVALGEQAAEGEEKERGLPQLIALYHCLDYDGDGWITQSDFTFAVLQSTIDPDHLERGPLLPPSQRGGSHRQQSQQPRSFLSRGTGTEAKRGGGSSVMSTVRE